MPKVTVTLPRSERIARKAARHLRRKEKLAASKSAGKGRGWHLKKLFLWEDSYFSFGKPIDAAEAVKIKKAIKA
jgi:hypothetical protein